MAHVLLRARRGRDSDVTVRKPSSFSSGVDESWNRRGGSQDTCVLADPEVEGLVFLLGLS